MKPDTTPELKAPDGATDCHMHVYDDRYTPVATAPFKPPQAPSAGYLEMQARLGLQRVVVVQPAAYGFDNRCTLEAMAALGPGARGIAVIPPAVDEAKMLRLDRAGVRGVRFFMLKGGLLPWHSLEAMAARIAPLGWHINLQLDGRDLPQHMPVLRRLPLKLVIDHNGKFLEPVGTADPAFRCLLELLDAGRTWIKLAAPYETSKIGPPRYDDVSALARTYVRTHPERCLWASNWPHPNQDPQPSSAAMLDMLLFWAEDDVTRRRILVDNPAMVYGY